MSALRLVAGGFSRRYGKRAFLGKCLAPGLALAVVLGLAMLLPAPALAQSARGPAEVPPGSFTGEQYIDSQGCAFGRARINGQERWVPRLRADRTPLCGLTPSMAASQPAGAPQVAPPAASATTPTTAPPQPRAAQASQPAARTTRPRQTAPAPVRVDAGEVMRHEAEIATVPCPRRYRGRNIVCLEREVFDRLQATVAARPHDPGHQSAPRGQATHSRQTDGRYVQVGTFAVPSNAQNTIARLQALGLPVARGDLRHRGRAMQVVLAGPFDNPAALHDALGQARRMGFSDAFIR